MVTYLEIVNSNASNLKCDLSTRRYRRFSDFFLMYVKVQIIQKLSDGSYDSHFYQISLMIAFTKHEYLIRQE